MVYYSSKTLDYTTIKNQQAYHAEAGTDHETSKKYKLQHTNAFVSYNRENECLFGCKLSRTTCSVREDKLCPPSLSKSSFARSKSSVLTQKRVFRPCRGLITAFPEESANRLVLKFCRGRPIGLMQLQYTGQSFTAVSNFTKSLITLASFFSTIPVIKHKLH